MGRWRVAVGLVLAALVGVPLASPLTRLAAPGAWRPWADPGRLLDLLRNTALLVGGTLAVALPLGTAAALLLYRTDLPLRRFFRFLLLLTLFLPLPLLASAWQSVLGLTSGGGEWMPWDQGIGSAVWMHALAGLPWVVLLVGLGLTGVERDLEEDAATAMHPWAVLWRVTLPRGAAALGMAAVGVGLQAATEISVTDVMQVRTFAEEVYTQFVGPEEGGAADPLARAVAVTLPFVALTALLVVVLAQRWEATLPAGAAALAPPLVFPLGRWRWPVALLAAAALALLLGAPVAGLLWRAGLAGTPREWSSAALLGQLRVVARAEGRHLLESLLVAGAAGVLCAGLGLVTCWAARGAPRFRAAVLVLLAVAWAMPGPVLGVGLTRQGGAIGWLLDVTGSPPWLARALWYGPSYLPVLWVDLIRFLPFAVAVLWPAVRLLPPELLEAAEVDGAGPGRRLLHVVGPLTARAAALAALAVAVLSLGELSAGKLVSTPEADAYAVLLFAQMHYGVTPGLAAQCLLLLAAASAGAAVVGLLATDEHR